MNKTKRNAMLKHRQRKKKLKERRKAMVLAGLIPATPKPAPKATAEIAETVAAPATEKKAAKKAAPAKTAKAEVKAEPKKKAAKAEAPAEAKKKPAKKSESKKS
jgi:hypothetical protein